MQTQTSNTLHNAIMEAGSKDRPPMLAPSNYVQWKSRIKRYIDTKPNHELIHYFLTNPPYKLDWKEKEVPISEGSPITRTERKQHQYEVNEIRAEKIARVANPLALVAQQQPIYHPQNHSTHYTQNSSTISQQATTRNRGKAINDFEDDRLVVVEQSEFVHDTYPIEQDAQIVIIDSLDMSYDREQIDQNDDDNDLANEREFLASLIEKLKCEIDEIKNRNKFLETSNKQTISKLKDNLSAHQETIFILSQQKEAQIKIYKTREDKELDKLIEIEQKVKVLDNIVYKTGQSVQTMNMLNNKCRMSFTKPEFLKKAQRATPNSDEVIHLEKESRSKLNDLIRPFDYDKWNNLYDLFVPQREKSSEQRYFSKRSRLSHTNVNNGKPKESFNKQTTLLEKRMDESIPLDKKLSKLYRNFQS
nr:hypothetical protein [Tanacetum cinerariifolium]